MSKKITLTLEKLEKEIRLAFIHGQWEYYYSNGKKVTKQFHI
jgi:hypothetical protein